MRFSWASFILVAYYTHCCVRCVLFFSFAPLAFSFFHRLITAFRCAFSWASRSLLHGDGDGEWSERRPHWWIHQFLCDCSLLIATRTHAHTSLWLWIDLSDRKCIADSCALSFYFYIYFFSSTSSSFTLCAIVLGRFFALNDYWICALLCVLFHFVSCVVGFFSVWSRWAELLFILSLALNWSLPAWIVLLPLFFLSVSCFTLFCSHDIKQANSRTLIDPYLERCRENSKCNEHQTHNCCSF